MTEMKKRPEISGLGALGFVVMIIGAAIFGGIWMMYVINKAEPFTAYLYGGIVGVPGTIIFIIELVKALRRADAHE